MHSMHGAYLLPSLMHSAAYRLQPAVGLTLLNPVADKAAAGSGFDVTKNVAKCWWVGL